MANLVHISTTKASLASTEILLGQIIYCADTQETYYDSSSGVRMELTKVTHILTEEEREDITSPSEDWLYVVINTNKFYKYSLTKGWQEMKYNDDIYNIIDTMEELVPGTILQFGNKIAPKTFATQVYTNRGERVQDVLDSISKIGYSVINYTIPNDNMMEFDIPLPFDKYFELNNFIDVYVGSTWIDPKRYYIEDDKLKLQQKDSTFAKDRDISYKFYYNTTTAPVDVIYQVHGGYMVNGSIPIRKMERYSSNYKLNDPTSVATSKALLNLYNDIDLKIASIAGNLIAHAVTEPGLDGKNLKTTIPNWTLVDNSTIYLKLSQDLFDGATLSVNGGPAYPIYLNYKEKVRGILKTGDVMSLTFSSIYNKFFVNGQTAYGLVHYSYTYEATGGESEILIDLPDWEPLTDKLVIYQNNIRLIEGINYQISDRNIVLTGYAADIGDTFVFEMDRVAGNGLPVSGNTIMAPITFWEDVIFNGNTTFNKDMHVNADLYLDGELIFAGGASSGSSMTAKQFISTIKTEEGPPMIVESQALVENFNADMVDGYHQYDLARPDKSIEFIIDGESDIMDSTVNIQLSAFYARLSTISDKMILTNTSYEEELAKRSMDDEVNLNAIEEDDPLYNANVRDTVEDIIYKLDNIRLYLLYTTDVGPDSSGSWDWINNSSGTDIPVNGNSNFELVETAFKTDYNTQVNIINDLIYEVEETMLRTMFEEEDPDIYLKEYEKIVNDRKNSHIEYIKSDGKTEAIKARYLLHEEKRIYPITHRNAIIGLPTTELATASDLNVVRSEVSALRNTIENQANLIDAMDTTLRNYKQLIWELYKEVFGRNPSI